MKRVVFVKRLLQRIDSYNFKTPCAERGSGFHKTERRFEHSNHICCCELLSKIAQAECKRACSVCREGICFMGQMPAVLVTG